MTWSWEMAKNLYEVHELLCASDAHHAQIHGLPVPVRRFESTRRYVEAGVVHLLRYGGDAAGMFTLTWESPFDEHTGVFPNRWKPAYLQRLALHPEWLQRDSLVGTRCLRRAIELATDTGADALRAEANPDLLATCALLRLFGFEQYGLVYTNGILRRIYLEKKLAGILSSGGASP